jgi:hypothetical protein
LLLLHYFQAAAATAILAAIHAQDHVQSLYAVLSQYASLYAVQNHVSQLATKINRHVTHVV